MTSKTQTAAKHTYDVGYKKWENFDVDAALDEVDTSGESRTRPSGPPKSSGGYTADSSPPKAPVVTSDAEEGNAATAQAMLDKACVQQARAGRTSSSQASGPSQSQGQGKAVDIKKEFDDITKEFGAKGQDDILNSIPEAPKVDIDEGKLQGALAADQAFEVYDEDFDVEAEEQQCEQAQEALQRLIAARSDSTDENDAREKNAALDELPALLGEYSSLIGNETWRKQHTGKLQDASDALLGFLVAEDSIQSEREMEQEIRDGKEVEEIRSAVDALKKVLDKA